MIRLRVKDGCKGHWVGGRLIVAGEAFDFPGSGVPEAFADKLEVVEWVPTVTIDCTHMPASEAPEPETAQRMVDVSSHVDPEPVALNGGPTWLYQLAEDLGREPDKADLLDFGENQRGLKLDGRMNRANLIDAITEALE